MSPPSSSISSEEAQSQTLTLNLSLIPGLPNDVASLILASVPFSHHTRLKSISKLWKIFFSSKNLIPLRQRDSKLSNLICVFPEDPLVGSPYLFDPENSAWCPLPPMPCNPYVYGLCNFSSISIGSQLYVLGGSLFDSRSFPMDRPTPSAAAFRFDFVNNSWECLSPMLSPRGSFACAAVPGLDRIVVAGGGSRHNMFGAAGSRMSSVEMYDIGKDEWMALDGLPRFRAGCVGFFVANGDEREFWVMGGYGESRTIMGVFPMDEYYKDAVVMELKDSWKWRELGDMWEHGERRRLGRTAVMEVADRDVPDIFMLDGGDIFRYDMASNRWWKETSLPRKAMKDSSTGFFALDGELNVVTLMSGIDSAENRKSRQQKKLSTLYMQIYNPSKKTWRSLITKPPFHQPLDLKTAVMCSIRL
ncbi:hypothetical protein RJ640_019631 [Escallonia rubra]|uniref:F-box domain-containing protein n=1 Tax=Escallonia rubra TaxID=112253 RepID=A0AA88QNR3_9ASTE|nr:hypothetical protein RJ640_019631 [Escallonia rubra]